VGFVLLNVRGRVTRQEGTYLWRRHRPPPGLKPSGATTLGPLSRSRAQETFGIIPFFRRIFHLSPEPEISRPYSRPAMSTPLANITERALTARENNGPHPCWPRLKATAVSSGH
jgi:hypothetical protein